MSSAGTPTVISIVIAQQTTPCRFGPDHQKSRVLRNNSLDLEAAEAKSFAMCVLVKRRYKNGTELR